MAYSNGELQFRYDADLKKKKEKQMNIIYYICGRKIEHPDGISDEEMAGYDQAAPRHGLTIVFSNNDRIAIVGKLILQITQEDVQDQDIYEIGKLNNDEVAKINHSLDHADLKGGTFGYWMTIETLNK